MRTWLKLGANSFLKTSGDDDMSTTESVTTQAGNHAADILAAAANKSTYIGAATAAVGGLSASDIAAFGGLALAAAGFLTNFYFRWRDDKRAEMEHAQRMCMVDRRADRRVGMPDTRSEPIERRGVDRRGLC